MHKVRLALLLTLSALALCGCATPVPTSRPVEVAPPKLPPAPADVMVIRKADFQERLLNFFSDSPQTPTGTPSSLPLVRP